MVPREDQNFIIKGKGRLQRKGQRKREKKEIFFLEKRLISKVIVKRKKTLREK